MAEELRFLKGAGEEFVVAPDGKTIVTNDGSLQRWNVETGKPIYRTPSIGTHSRSHRRQVYG